MSENIRLVRSDSSRLHCRLGTQRRVRQGWRYKDPLPPLPEPRRDNWLTLAASVSLLAAGTIIVFYAIYQMLTAGVR